MLQDLEVVVREHERQVSTGIQDPSAIWHHSTSSATSCELLRWLKNSSPRSVLQVFLFSFVRSSKGCSKGAVSWEKLFLGTGQYWYKMKTVSLFSNDKKGSMLLQPAQSNTILVFRLLWLHLCPAWPLEQHCGDRNYTESQNHRPSSAGRDPQWLWKSNSCPCTTLPQKVTPHPWECYPNASWTLTGMVPWPLPWVACSSAHKQ